MAEASQIAALCALLHRAWARTPDQSLIRLLASAVATGPSSGDLSSTDDADLAAGLERLLAGGSVAPPLPAPADLQVRWRDVGEPAASTVTLDGARLATFDVGPYYCEVLEVRFGGVYRHGSQGSPDAALMVRLLTTLLVRTSPDAVLLDLRALGYAWGDGMVAVLDAIGRFDAEYPLAVVVLAGPDSAPGLRSLGVTAHAEEEAAFAEVAGQALRRSFAIG